VQTPETTAAAGQPAQILAEPQYYCTSNVQPGTLSVDLKGWPEGLMTWGDWMDPSGPLDATEHLPAGGARNHDLSFATLQRFSVQRPRAVA
jgi:hypothetical protein